MSSEESFMLEANPSSSSEGSPGVQEGWRGQRVGAGVRRARGQRRGIGQGGRGGGRRGQGRGRGRGVNRQREGNGERVLALQEERRVRTEELLESLGLEEWRDLGRQLFAREPGVVFDALFIYQQRHENQQPAEIPNMLWCRCGRCRDLPTDLERLCCGQEPNQCISQLPHFSLYCLDEDNLRIHRRYREDLMVVRPAREPGDDNREYRYAAYRHFIFWQHGSLGQGNRLVIPSCCVWAIRDRFPDPHGQYTGFVPGR